ncbi:MAG: hypothetical protein MN733_07770 [Nitrososphaera sp.]|nr:hypothetical protein [Nitrososphaera sp.]
MQVKTWLQRLTDESNLWFNAVKAEDEGDFVLATSLYIKDASECARQNTLVRCALSCSCAANCIAKLGALENADKLYNEAARIYAENSVAAMSESIREVLWSLQEAYENFVLGGDYEGAEDMQNKFLTLSARTSPFPRRVEAEWELDQRKKAAESAKSMRSANEDQTAIPDQLFTEIDSFLILRTSARRETVNPFDPRYVLRIIDSSGGSKLSEKGIAS